jgi:hypothetical protein
MKLQFRAKLQLPSVIAIVIALLLGSNSDYSLK